MKPLYEVSDIVNIHFDHFVQKHRPAYQVIKTLKAIKACRTAVLGGHKDKCGCCGHEQVSYNSCRNRHCPKCQATNRERWILDRESELLHVPYYHIVFTLPHDLNPLALQFPKHIYNALFKAAWKTMAQFAGDPKYLGAKTGMTAVLHTWGQQLALHPHLHCIVPAGGIDKNGKWKYVQQENKKSSRNGKYLYPKRALGQVFRAIFMKELRKTVDVPQDVAKKLFAQNWVVYAKKPFLSPQIVVEYLARYTHKIAISNHRLTKVDDRVVSFNYKNYRTGANTQNMTLDGVEFLRRFAQHILPSGFVRIRHYGFLASRNKPTDLNSAKKCLGQQPWHKEKPDWQFIAETKLNIIPGQCPKCKEGLLAVIEIIDPLRGPPINKC